MKITTIPIISLIPLVLLSLFLNGCSSSGASDSSVVLAPVVQTQVGQVQGVMRSYAPASSSSYTVSEYRGIPYALAPTGDWRWALPRPVTALGDGIFKAYDFGPACPQQARFNLTQASYTEDCLTINVSIPAGTKAGDNLPVLFWIHGGAFIGGSSSLYRLDKLAGAGRLVVVSINYRLGALGFMPNDAFKMITSSGTYNGNYGLEDQRLAMRWVQQNIAAFGGDSSSVTIAGESAGAGSVCMHLASPSQVTNLFKQAITQSAGCMQILPTVTQAQTAGKASATIQNALCPSSTYTTPTSVLNCMRGKTIDQILSEQGTYTTNNPLDITSFSPVTGDPTASPPLINTTVPSSFRYAVTNNAVLTVPMMMGGTKEELGLYIGYYWQGAQAIPPVNPPINNSTIDSYWLPIFYSSHATQVSNYAAYTTNLHSSDSNVVAKTLGQVISNYNPTIGINNCLYLQTSNVMLNYISRNPGVSAPIYQFEFDDPAAPVCKVGIAEPCPPYEMGPVHSSELNYLFPNLSNTSAINGPDLAPASQILANQMVSYWAQFAYTGNPNVSGLPTWPLYTGKQTSSVMLLKPEAVAPYDSDDAHQCTVFWATGSMYDLRNAPPFP